MAKNDRKKIKRVQTGMRIETRILKVLKAVATHHEMTLGDLIEGICLHCFEGKTPFGDETLKLIEMMKDFYKMDLTAADSHKLSEE